MSKGADRFRVGQRCYFVFGPSMGWHRVNGEECTIIAPKQLVDVWCYDIDGGNERLAKGVERYLVRWREGEVWTAEQTLRPLRDSSPKLSTWETFVKKTGIDPRKKVKAVRRTRQGA